MTNPEKRSTILVVDDNPPTLYSTSRVLRAANFAVWEASSGSEAIARAGDVPDLIILDVNLPDIDGFTVCRTLRASPATARTPVIHLSATFVKDVDKVQGLDAGADGYLTHPVEPPVLIATVNAFLRARQAEEAMRSSEAKFKAVFENALNGIALLSDSMVYLDVNPAVCRMLGRDRQHIVGKHVSAFLPHDAENIFLDANRLEMPGSWTGSFPVLHAGGHLLHLEWSISIHSVPDTRLAIITDITERKAIEADRERLLESERAARGEAERANRMKDDFLAALSHELRTPLNTIVVWSEVLHRQFSHLDPELQRGIEAIARNAKVQTQLIADLLDVSRITSGKLHLDLQRFDPVALVEASITSGAAAAKAKNVQMRMRVVGEPAPMVWDQARFQQVVWNLIDNALKFSDGGGTIEITLAGTSEAVELTVRDSGHGIAPDFLPHIFDRFSQEDASTRRRHGGLGLGLAIVKQVIEAHGGTITAYSEGESQGATFAVHLPRLRATEPADRETPVRASLHGVHVLVVEDDSDARSLIARVLREAQADVCDAASVADALTALADFHPDVIVSDIGMPNQDGYDLIRHVRQAENSLASVPAVAVTAFSRDEDRDRALESGYQRYLTKPVDTFRLIDVVTALVADARKGV